MGQVTFIIWRESIEALLLISIIYAWIKQYADCKQGLKYLWGGVAIGIVFSTILASIIYGVFNLLSDTGQSLLLIAMEFIAAILIVQMVYSMNSHGKSVKADIESGLAAQTKDKNWWVITFIVALAIAREGSEIVVFLSSFIMSLNLSNAFGFASEVFIGIAIAALTIYFFSIFNKFVSWRFFFRVTGIILLFLALSLFLRGMEESINYLIEYDYAVPDFLYFPAWDTSAFIDDSSLLGNLFASFFGYRSQPIWLSVISFAVYWIFMALLFLPRGSYAQKI